MKIYINDTDFNGSSFNGSSFNGSVFKKVCAFDATYTRHLIYTNEGIFCNHNKKLTLIDTINNKCDNVIYNNCSFLLDYSVEEYKDYITHIPYDHLYCDETFEKKHIGHDIFYIRHSYFDQVSHYFEVERLEDFMYDEILSFLSGN